MGKNNMQGAQGLTRITAAAAFRGAHLRAVTTDVDALQPQPAADATPSAAPASAPSHHQ